MQPDTQQSQEWSFRLLNAGSARGLPVSPAPNSERVRALPCSQAEQEMASLDIRPEPGKNNSNRHEIPHDLHICTSIIQKQTREQPWVRTQKKSRAVLVAQRVQAGCRVCVSLTVPVCV
ncbi:hypothetical protein NDU88_003014 [Pleurodeles waltl]|uniref:Uncharacterized protein n=1 Tax=Pleurodeles waltl TaxID=8319 RepID=A0AAV7UCK5_PLEWA|nr:hypothetical protein NDU88_003014 [Pleurodeles waltl]